MPQLSLYIDKETLQKIQAAAKMEHLSISKYVVRKLNESMCKAWPQQYQDLFGSINDDTFNADRPKGFSNDHKRESL